MQSLKISLNLNLFHFKGWSISYPVWHKTVLEISTNPAWNPISANNSSDNPYSNKLDIHHYSSRDSRANRKAIFVLRSRQIVCFARIQNIFTSIFEQAHYYLASSLIPYFKIYFLGGYITMESKLGQLDQSKFLNQIFRNRLLSRVYRDFKIYWHHIHQYL